MPVLTQIAHISAIWLAITALLVAVRGLPADPAPTPEVAACGAGPETQTLEPAWISPDEARELLEDASVAFVDCRTQNEFVSGHVAGALHVPAETVTLSDEVRERLQAASAVVTYCDAATGCERSQRVATIFQAAGIHDVRVLRGGLPAWLERGYPAESGMCPLCLSTN